MLASREHRQQALDCSGVWQWSTISQKDNTVISKSHLSVHIIFLANFRTLKLKWRYIQWGTPRWLVNLLVQVTKSQDTCHSFSHAKQNQLQFSHENHCEFIFFIYYFHRWFYHQENIFDKTLNNIKLFLSLIHLLISLYLISWLIWVFRSASFCTTRPCNYSINRFVSSPKSWKLCFQVD